MIDNILGLLLAFFVFFCMFMIIFLVFYHWKLCLSGLTTNEHLKDLYNRSFASPLPYLNKFQSLRSRLKLCRPKSLLSNAMLKGESDRLVVKSAKTPSS